MDTCSKQKDKIEKLNLGFNLIMTDEEE